jgi:hypothetical protein
MAYVIYPYLFARKNVFCHLSSAQKEEWKKNPQMYKWIVAQVFLGLGQGKRLDAYSQYIPDIIDNPYMRKLVGQALWFLATALHHERLPLFNYLLVPKGGSIPRGSLEQEYIEKYDSSGGYTSFCQTQQSTSVIWLDSGRVVIKMPKYLTTQNSFAIAITIRNYIQNRGLDVATEKLHKDVLCKFPSHQGIWKKMQRGDANLFENFLTEEEDAEARRLNTLLIEDAEIILGQQKERWV